MEFFKIVFNLPEILSSLYAILMIVGYIPGLIALVKFKDLTGVGKYFWFFIVITVGISFYNLIVTEANIFQVYAVGINLGLGIVCLVIHVFKSRDYGIAIRDFSIFLIVLIVLSYLYLDKPHVTQSVASISIILAYIGQIVNYFKTKTASGTSKWLFLIMGTGLMCLITSMVLTDTYPHIIATEAFNFILIMVCYLQANYYERGLNNEKNSEFGKNS
uniref:Uncharacterized protein n=1 Tax=Mammaliicoccus phage MSShimriz1 TaxID=3230127 RepID=A0AAU8GTH7_9VIRU